MKALLVLLLMASLGCAAFNSAATHPNDWTKANAPAGEFERDRYACMTEADVLASDWMCAGLMCLIASSPYPEYFSACMEARGWHRR